MTQAQYEVSPARMALVNIDMQVAFVEGTPLSAPGGVALLPTVNRLAEACRACGIMVIHTRHVTRPDGSNLGTMGELIESVRAGYIMEGSETAELHAGLEVKPSDIVLNKPRYGAFTGTDLDNLLRANGIDTIIVSGICTNICCETSAREAGCGTITCSSWRTAPRRSLPAAFRSRRSSAPSTRPSGSPSRM